MSKTPEIYDINVEHSSMMFKVRHILNTVTGKFQNFKGSLTLDIENPEQSSAEITIPVSSIDTGNEKRDEHLQTADFFNAEKYPNLEFKTTKWEKVGDEAYKLHGVLQMAGVSRPVTLDAELLGFADHPQTGGKVTGWSGSVAIKRSDWGIQYGIPMVGDEVKLEISVQGHLRT